MNPDTNLFEELRRSIADEEPKRPDPEDDKPDATRLQQLEQALREHVQGGSRLVRPDGSPVPKEWSVFTAGEEVVCKEYTFRIAHIGEGYMVLEPVGVPAIGGGS